MVPLPLISLTVYKCLVFPLLCVSLPFVSVCLIAVLYFCCCFELSDFLHFIFLDIESFLQRPALWVLSPSTRAAVCDTSSADSRDLCCSQRCRSHCVLCCWCRLSLCACSPKNIVRFKVLLQAAHFFPQLFSSNPETHWLLFLILI